MPGAKHRVVGQERARFLSSVTDLLASRAAHRMSREDLRQGVMRATWDFASRCRLSADLERSIVKPLGQKARGPSIISGP